MLFGNFIARLGEIQEFSRIRFAGAELRAEAAGIAPYFEETPTDDLRCAVQRFASQASAEEALSLRQSPSTPGEEAFQPLELDDMASPPCAMPDFLNDP